MPRPVTISDIQILDAAREVFLERGIRATTSEVAARAGVSEGILFKRFASKEQLFQAAMQVPRGPASAPWLSKLPSRVGKTTIEQQFLELGHEAIAFFRLIMPLAMMSWSNAPPGGVPPHLDVAEPPPIVTKRLLGEYFAAEQRIGRLRAVNPDLLARTFIGTVFNFVWLDLMACGRDPTPLSEAAFVAGIVDLLLTGAGPPAPRTDETAGPQSRASKRAKTTKTAQRGAKAEVGARRTSKRAGDKRR